MNTKGYIKYTHAEGVEWRPPFRTTEREAQQLAYFAKKYGHLLNTEVHRGEPQEWLTLAGLMIQHYDNERVESDAIELEGVFFGIMRRRKGTIPSPPVAA